MKLVFRNFSSRLDDFSSLPSSAIGLLSAFFIAHHYGGSLKVREEEGVSFELFLPLDGLEADLPLPEPFWLDELFARYEE